MSVTSGSVTTILEKYDGRYVRLDWTQDSSFNSDTVSQINWTAYIEDDDSTSQSGWWYITSQVYFEVVCTQGTFRKTSNVSTNTSNRIDVLTYDNDRRQNVGQIGSGSFYITHDINGEATFIINLKAAIYVWAINSTGSGTFTLPFKGGEVSSAKFLSGPGIIKPGSDYAILWSGAEAGKANSINKYKVYYTTDGTDPTAGSSYLETTKTYLETTAPTTLNRGDQIRYKVQSIGQHGESTLSTATAVARINQLPAAPSITNDSAIPTYYPVGGGRPIFKLAPGEDADVGQTLSIYYATTASTSEKTLCGKTFKPQVSTSTTYYFWTYDGLEFSNTSTSRYIEVETVEPSILSISATTSSYSARNMSGFVNQVTPTIKTNTTGTVDMYIVYSSTASTDFANYKRQIQIPSEELTSSATSTNGQILSTIPVEKYITEVYNNSKNFNYRLKFIVRNENGRSESVFYPSNSYLSIAGAPSSYAQNNQTGTNSNIPGSLTNHMGKIARIRYYVDESTNPAQLSVLISCTTSNGKQFTFGQNDFAVSYTSDPGTFVITFNDFPPNDATLDMFISTKTQYLTKTFKVTYKTAKAPNLTKISGIPANFVPFDASGSIEVTMGWPFGSSNNMTAAYTDYEFTSDNLKLYNTVDDTSVLEYTDTGDTALSWSRNSRDLLSATIPQSRLYIDVWKYHFGIEHYVGTYDYNVFMRITNVYGQEFESTWVLRTLNFNKAPVLSNIGFRTYFRDWGSSGSQKSTVNPNLSNQTSYIYFDFNITYYSYTDTFVTLTRTIGANEDNPIYIARITESGGTHTLVDSLAAKTINFQNTNAYRFYIESPIDSATPWVWSLEASNSIGSVSSPTGSMINNVIYHVLPTISLGKLEIEESGNYYLLKGSYTISDLGFNYQAGVLRLDDRNGYGQDYLNFKLKNNDSDQEVDLGNVNLNLTTSEQASINPQHSITKDFEIQMTQQYLNATSTFEIYAKIQTRLMYSGTLDGRSDTAYTTIATGQTTRTLMYKDAATMIYRPHGVGINGLAGNDIFQARALAPNSEKESEWRHNIRFYSYKYNGLKPDTTVDVDTNTTYTLVYNPSQAVVTFMENGVTKHEYNFLKGTFR